MASEAGKGKKTGFPETCRQNTTLLTSWFYGLLTSRSVRINLCCFKPAGLCETNKALVLHWPLQDPLPNFGLAVLYSLLFLFFFLSQRKSLELYKLHARKPWISSCTGAKRVYFCVCVYLFGCCVRSWLEAHGVFTVLGPFTVELYGISNCGPWAPEYVDSQRLQMRTSCSAHIS